MPHVRSDLWCAAFVRRHNDRGRICVVTRKGDPIAGQIWIEIDHLDGTASLFRPAPSLLYGGSAEDRLFETSLQHAAPATIRERLDREAQFDPDFWLLTLETRDDEYGFAVVGQKPGDHA